MNSLDGMVGRQQRQNYREGSEWAIQLTLLDPRLVHLISSGPSHFVAKSGVNCCKLLWTLTNES